MQFIEKNNDIPLSKLIVALLLNKEVIGSIEIVNVINQINRNYNNVYFIEPNNDFDNIAFLIDFDGNYFKLKEEFKSEKSLIFINDKEHINVKDWIIEYSGDDVLNMVNDINRLKQNTNKGLVLVSKK